MSMRVLFLATDATRRRAVGTETARVIANGGRAVVVVRTKRSWQDTPFAPGVEVFERATLDLRAPTRRLESLVLFRLPRKVYGLLGRGPLRRPVASVFGVHQKVSTLVQRRVVLPCQRLMHRDGPRGGKHVLYTSSFDVVIVADSASMPEAVKLTAGASEVRPEIAYSIEHLPT